MLFRSVWVCNEGRQVQRPPKRILDRAVLCSLHRSAFVIERQLIKSDYGETHERVTHIKSTLPSGYDALECIFMDSASPRVVLR